MEAKTLKMAYVEDLTQDAVVEMRNWIPRDEEGNALIPLNAVCEHFGFDGRFIDVRKRLRAALCGHGKYAAYNHLAAPIKSIETIKTYTERPALNFTEEQVRDYRAAAHESGVSIGVLLERFGLAESLRLSLWQMTRGVTYKHLDKKYPPVEVGTMWRGSSGSKQGRRAERERIFELHNEGQSMTDIAQVIGKSLSHVSRVVNGKRLAE